jgi:hypothetical protein
MPFDVPLAEGVGNGVIDATVSPFVCTEDAVIGGGEPVFRVKETKGLARPYGAQLEKCSRWQWMLDQRQNIYVRA